MTITVGYVSDIHVEFRGHKFTNLIKMNTDVLCLAGDICACGTKEDFALLIDFLKFICPKYKYVIHVPGNHEYYTAGETKISKWHTMQDIDARLKAIEKIIPNYIHLNCQAATLTINSKQYVFIGATLWAHVDKKNYDNIQNGMNDYSYIYQLKNQKPTKLTVVDMQKIHNKHVAFLTKAIEKFKGYPCVVITHHKPIGDTVDKDILTQAYETDLTNIIGMRGSTVKYAIHGHTHRHYNKLIKGIRYLSNPKGYVGQHTKFIDDISIKL
jgi:predicted phosphohydrolase